MPDPLLSVEIAAERDALLVALAWVCDEIGWRLLYHATTPPPPGLVSDGDTSAARWQWPPEGATDG